MISFIKIFSVVTFTSVFCFGQNSINEIRENYLCAHKQKCLDRLIVISNFNLDNPLIYCYNTSAQIMMISNDISPYKKLIKFNKLTNRLDSIVNHNYSDIEIRMIRYAIQKKSPFFLGYDNNINEDLVYINENIDFLPHNIRIYVSKILKILNNG